VGAGLAYGL